jgi:hypothetical protein
VQKKGRFRASHTHTSTLNFPECGCYELRCIDFCLSFLGAIYTIGTRAMGPAFRSLWVAENRPYGRPDGS